MKPVIGITMGDPAGVGGEIAVRALAHPALYEQCTPVLIGDRAAVEDALRFCGIELEVRTIASPAEAAGRPGVIDLVDLGLLQPGGWEYGKVSALCGGAAFGYVEEGIRLAVDGEVQAVVTGPINKEALHLAGHRYSGHTEIFAEKTGVKSYAMLLMGGPLRVIHVTTHISMRQACDRITRQRVLTVIRLAREAMELMGIPSPRIGVAGFNAHAGENGLFGDEEIREIIPAIADAAAEGIQAEGPVPPDTVFVKAAAGQYDIVVAMYHDQGHIPLKLISFKMDPETKAFTSMSGVNCTVGLPIIRTSVDHGTAFDRAGKGCANEESLLDAVRVAVEMAGRRFR